MSAMLKQKLIDIANGFTKYGLWKGGSNLSELDDVTLTNLQTNDVLTYNGSEWVNDDNLQTQINTLNSNLEYAYLAELIGFYSDNLSLFFAYKENGIITLNLNIPHSVTGIFSAKINSDYAPRIITYGIAIYNSSSNDVGKIPSSSITTDGTINVWIAQALDGIEAVQFSYPMKRL